MARCALPFDWRITRAILQCIYLFYQSQNEPLDVDLSSSMRLMQESFTREADLEIICSLHGMLPLTAFFLELTSQQCVYLTTLRLSSTLASELSEVSSIRYSRCAL